MELQDEAAWISVIKCISSPSFDRDPTPWMHPVRLNLSRYNSRLKHVHFDEIRWTASLLTPRATILRSVDPALLSCPRVLHSKYRVELSPTREKSEGRFGYIMWRDYTG